MRIGFLVNDIKTENPVYTTTRLAHMAVKMGHESWYLGVGDFVYAKDGSIHANARSARRVDYDSLESYLEGVGSKEAKQEMDVNPFTMPAAAS